MHARPQRCVRGKREYCTATAQPWAMGGIDIRAWSSGNLVRSPGYSTCHHPVNLVLVGVAWLTFWIFSRRTRKIQVTPCPMEMLSISAFFIFLSAPKGEALPCFAPRDSELPSPGHRRIPESTCRNGGGTQSMQSISDCTLMGLIVAIPHISRKANGRCQDTLETRHEASMEKTTPKGRNLPI